MQTKSEIEIYIHIPFCIRKCFYCDFLSAPADDATIEKYIQRLLSEVTDRSPWGDYVVTSVFVGGGTPTILSGERLADILTQVKSCFFVSEDAEITLECNPGTADYEKLKLCRDAGYNRISIGLQSALDEELKRIGRIHDYARFLDTYKAAVKAGFENINIDLISALPDQDMEDLDKTLDKVLTLSPRPTHISAYSLIVEEGTAFGDMEKSGKLTVPDEDTERKMHWRAFDRLSENGYVQYELSNLALPGYECRHNIGYWIRKEYLGFGAGASSFFKGRRFTNTKNVSEYIAGKNVLSEDYEISKNDAIEEFMFLGLRMTKGVCIENFAEEFGRDIFEIFGREIDKKIEEGLLEIYSDNQEKKQWLRLTKKGQDVANYVFQVFLFDS